MATLPLAVNEAPTLLAVKTVLMAFEFLQPLSVKLPACETPEVCPVAVYAFRPMASVFDGKVTWHDHPPEASAIASHEVVKLSGIPTTTCTVSPARYPAPSLLSPLSVTMLPGE